MTKFNLSTCGALLLLVLLAQDRVLLAQDLLLTQDQSAAQAGASNVPAPASPAQASPVPEASAPAAAAPSTPRRHPSARPLRPTLDDRIAVLAKNLELTDIQRTALKNILLDRQRQTLRIRNSAAPGNVRVDQFRALQDQTVNQIRSILTDEQKKKYDPLLARKIPASDTPQRSVEDWIKATTPH